MSNTWKIALDACEKADLEYYNEGSSSLTDAEYDKLKKLLRDKYKDIQEVSSYLAKVGASPSSHLTEVDLVMHMGSQIHSTTDDEFLSWYNKYGCPEIVVSDKVDGSSVELLYEDGKLVRVATRGDGSRGNDITRNAVMWKNIPKDININGRCVVRGEAILYIQDWKNYCSDKANPRNAGNGIIMRKSDPSKNAHMRVLAFDIVHPTVEFKKHHHKFKTLEALGFDTPRYYICRSKEDVEKCRQHYIDDRALLPYEIDGMVAAIDDMKVQEDLGYADGGKRPKGQNAWKLNTEKGVTKVVDIELTMGQTGKIVPTAVLEPIFLAGTTVTHCLLNNFDYIRELGVDVGDEVIIEKAGDIIPHCLAVVGVKYKCPACGFVGDYYEQINHHS